MRATNQPYPAEDSPSAEQLAWAAKLDVYRIKKQPTLMKYYVAFAKEVEKTILKRVKEVATRKKLMEEPIDLVAYALLIKGINSDLKALAKKGVKDVKKVIKNIFDDALIWSGDQYGVDLSIGAPDKAVLNHFYNKYFPPTFENIMYSDTPYNYKNTLYTILKEGLDNHWNWNKIIRNFESYLSIKGKNFPRFMYERVVRTEVARFVVEGHIRAHIKMGFTHFRRLVVEDERTNEVDCLPFINWIYPAAEVSGVLPAHPNCRCDMTPEPIGKKAIKMFAIFTQRNMAVA